MGPSEHQITENLDSYQRLTLIQKYCHRRYSVEFQFLKQTHTQKKETLVQSSSGSIQHDTGVQGREQHGTSLEIKSRSLVAETTQSYNSACNLYKLYPQPLGFALSAPMGSIYYGLPPWATGCFFNKCQHLLRLAWRILEQLKGFELLFSLSTTTVVLSLQV